MSDRLTEALAWWEATDFETRAVKGPPIVLTGDQILDFAAFCEAARRWHDFPTDNDVERLHELMCGFVTLSSLDDSGITIEDVRAMVLEAVKREDR